MNLTNFTVAQVREMKAVEARGTILAAKECPTMETFLNGMLESQGQTSSLFEAIFSATTQERIISTKLESERLVDIMFKACKEAEKLLRDSLAGIYLDKFGQLYADVRQVQLGDGLSDEQVAMIEAQTGLSVDDFCEVCRFATDDPKTYNKVRFGQLPIPATERTDENGETTAIMSGTLPGIRKPSVVGDAEIIAKARENEGAPIRLCGIFETHNRNDETVPAATELANSEA